MWQSGCPINSNNNTHLLFHLLIKFALSIPFNSHPDPPMKLISCVILSRKKARLSTECEPGAPFHPSSNHPTLQPSSIAPITKHNGKDKPQLIFIMLIEKVRGAGGGRSGESPVREGLCHVAYDDFILIVVRLCFFCFCFFSPSSPTTTDSFLVHSFADARTIWMRRRLVCCSFFISLSQSACLHIHFPFDD